MKQNHKNIYRGRLKNNGSIASHYSQKMKSMSNIATLIDNYMIIFIQKFLHHLYKMYCFFYNFYHLFDKYTK